MECRILEADTKLAFFFPLRQITLLHTAKYLYRSSKTQRCLVKRSILDKYKKQHLKQMIHRFQLQLVLCTLSPGCMFTATCCLLLCLCVMALIEYVQQYTSFCHNQNSTVANVLSLAGGANFFIVQLNISIVLRADLGGCSRKSLSNRALWCGFQCVCHPSIERSGSVLRGLLLSGPI